MYPSLLPAVIADCVKSIVLGEHAGGGWLMINIHCADVMVIKNLATWQSITHRNVSLSVEKPSVSSVFIFHSASTFRFAQIL